MSKVVEVMLGLASSMLVVIGCTATNPAYEGDDGDAGATGVGTASSPTTLTGASANDSVDPDSSGAATSEPGCGDMIIDEPQEECDDGNEDDHDGCLANCMIPASCLEILEYDPEAQSGSYLIAPREGVSPWLATCDMDKDGGGWTGFRVQDTCNDRLRSEVTPIQPSEGLPMEDAGVDDQCRPYTLDRGLANHTYVWDIEFPPELGAFYVLDYRIRNNSEGAEEVDLLFDQLSWEVANDYPNGAVSLGSADEPGPATSWARDGGEQHICGGCEVAYPLQQTPFILAAPTTTLRIGWGEAGPNSEGLFPWWDGQIFVR